jgi:hypothetical protein
MLKKTVKKISVRDGGHKLKMTTAYNDRCFWVINGPVLSNLDELRRALKVMTDEQFAHHVTSEKNDFALWVGGVLEDEVCAKKLQRAKSAKKAAEIIDERIEDYHH